MWHNGLAFFFDENLRNFLYLACGCYVEKYYQHRSPKQPRTYTALVVRVDIQQRIAGIIGQAQTRISSDFGIKSTADWLEDTNRLLTELRATSAIPNASTDATTQKPPPSSRKDSSTVAISEDFRLARIDYVHYRLTPNQGKMLKALWPAYQSETQSLSESELKAAMGPHLGKPRDSWRTSPLWGSIVVVENRRYRLDLTRKDI